MSGHDFDAACPACRAAFSKIRYLPRRRRLTLGPLVLRAARPGMIRHVCEHCGYRWTALAAFDGGTGSHRYPVNDR